MVNRTVRCHAVLLNLGTGSPEAYWESLPAYPYKTRSPKEHCDVVGLAPLVGFCWFVGCELENFSFFFFRKGHPTPKLGMSFSGSLSWRIDCIWSTSEIFNIFKGDLSTLSNIQLAIGKSPLAMLMGPLGPPCHGHGLLICSVHAGRGIRQDEALVIA